MARKSKYISQAHDSGSALWQAALYQRLSREDGDKDESDSINNQRNILVDFANDEDDIEIVDYYIDDGWSGTNFQRPAFLQMLEDIKSGRINCVIVKDLSRFGRNYIESGNFIEKVFPFLNVRFIAVTDYLDSHKNPQSMNNVIVPFKNIINDEYCRDISNKIRSSLDIKRKQGKHIGSFALYGYVKNKDDNNRIDIDCEAAEVVKYIYDEFLKGAGCIGIAKKLNEKGIPNPTEYKRKQGLNYRHKAGGSSNSLWSDITIRRILKNRMYTGCMVQGVNKTKSYKLQVSVLQREEDWFVVENTHEAIIEKEIFEKVRQMFKRDTRTSPKLKALHLFSGFLRCADCQRAMNRKTISQPYGEYNYFVCSTFKKAGKSACSKHTIRAERLEEAVFATIKQQIKLAVDMDEIVRLINEKGKNNQGKKHLENQLIILEQAREKCEDIRLALYPDWKCGDITKAEYHSLKNRYTSEIAKLNNQIDNIRAEVNEAENGVDNNNGFLKAFAKYREIAKISREILTELVDYIYIHEGGNLTIVFKYADEYEKAAGFIEDNPVITTA